VLTPRVLLCDLDGTLIDTMPRLAELATEILAATYGLPRGTARARYLETCGRPFGQQLELLLPGDPGNAAAEAAFEARKPALFASERMSPATRAALDRLAAAGVRVVVSSNNTVENVTAFARRAAFPFALALGNDGHDLAKGPAHVALVEETLGVPRAQMCFVGDSLHDGWLARHARIPFVGITGTFSAARFAAALPGVPVVDAVAALPRLFGLPAVAARRSRLTGASSARDSAGFASP
jgi:phosphoglycolate phosphatase